MHSLNQSVSVVIPAYNAARYIGEAIESVLGQGEAIREIVVVEDGSDAPCEYLVRSFGKKVRYFRQEHAGIGAARNTGVERTSGIFLAFLDADDVWCADKISTQLPLLDGREMVFGMAEQFISPDKFSELNGRVVFPAHPMPALHAGALLIRKDDFLRAGYFSSEWHSEEFIDWFSHATATGFKYAIPDQVVLRRRIHGNNTTFQRSNSAYARVLYEKLKRERS